MLRKLVDSNDRAILQVSSSMFSNLNKSVHLLRWLRLSGHTSTSELRNRSCTGITIESFRVFRASAICRSARNFLISVMTFSIVIARWVIDGAGKSMTCMRGYARKPARWASIRQGRSCHWSLLRSFEALFLYWLIRSLGPQKLPDMLDVAQHDISSLRLLISVFRPRSLWW